MKQETIWMRFLIIGISVLVLNSMANCTNKTMEQLKHVSYIYRNDSNTDLIMRIYNNSNNLINSFVIPSKEEVLTNTTISEGGPSLFFFDTNINSIGDSIVVEFKTNKCLCFGRGSNHKIFDISLYNNYSEELLKLNEYSLKYVFTEDEYNQAEDCN